MSRFGPSAQDSSGTAPTRRRVLASLAALTAAAATACTASPDDPGGDRLNSGVVDVPPAAHDTSPDGRALTLQVLAHPDDDLYFMNPDIQQTVRAGVPVVSVYLTAGEAGGINRPPGRPRPHADPSSYTAARQQGLRQAYAAMLGAPVLSPWQRAALNLPAGLAAEVDTLEYDGRRAELVFLQLREFGADGKKGGGDNLPELWGRPGATLTTLVARGSVVRTQYTYRRENLIDVLAWLMDCYRPSVLRTLDPDPDIQIHDAKHRISSDQPGYSDHRDHTTAGLFAWRAMDKWTADALNRDGRPPRFVTTSYRGYYNQRWPFNLPQETVREKTGLLDAYGGRPDEPCGNPAGCGDYSQGQGKSLREKKGWARSTHYRYPAARPVPDTDPDGRLAVYGVLGNQAARWRETAPGSGHWEQPQNLGGGPLAPALALVRTPPGHRLLFGLRFSALEGPARRNTRQIVLLDQRVPGDAETRWTSLGNPETDPSRGRRIGTPLAVAVPDGRVFLFVRNASKGLSGRVMAADGRWGPWANLGGQEVQEGLTAVVDRGSRVHVFAAGRDSVHQWTQDSPTAPVRFRPLGRLPVPGDGPGACVLPDGSIQLAYPLARTARVQLERIRPDNPVDFPGWDTTPWTVGSSATALAGAGTPVLCTTTDSRAGRLALLGREPDGTLRYSSLTDSGMRTWKQGRRLPAGAPALAGADTGDPTVVALGLDAEPWTWRPLGTARA